MRFFSKFYRCFGVLLFPVVACAATSAPDTGSPAPLQHTMGVAPARDVNVVNPLNETENKTPVQGSATKVGLCEHQTDVCVAGLFGGPIAAMHHLSDTNTCVDMVRACVVCPYVSFMGGCVGSMCCPFWCMTGPWTNNDQRLKLKTAVLCQGEIPVYDVLCPCSPCGQNCIGIEGPSIGASQSVLCSV